MDAIRNYLRMLSANERGATAIEYGLIVGLIAVACIGAFTNLGGGVQGKWGLLLTTVSTYM